MVAHPFVCKLVKINKTKVRAEYKMAVYTRYALPSLRYHLTVHSLHKCHLEAYMQKAGDSWDISPQIFLDFPQNFRLRTRNQYCTQAIA